MVLLQRRQGALQFFSVMFDSFPRYRDEDCLDISSILELDLSSSVLSVLYKFLPSYFSHFVFFFVDVFITELLGTL